MITAFEDEKPPSKYAGMRRAALEKIAVARGIPGAGALDLAGLIRALEDQDAVPEPEAAAPSPEPAIVEPAIVTPKKPKRK